MPDAKRTQLKKKIEAGEARNKARAEPTLIDRTGEKAIEAKDKFTAFAKEHPIATVAGGLALGILISGLFKRSPTRWLMLSRRWQPPTRPAAQAPTNSTVWAKASAIPRVQSAAIPRTAQAICPTARASSLATPASASAALFATARTERGACGTTTMP